ncbi:MAG: cbb3-type cytochrome c oxidase subunit II [Limisphaerales bacterium]
MNYGPLLFLAAFFALAGSWFGFVLTPQAQIGQLQQTNMLGAPTLYPQARPGLARQGLDVYRANGCADCHSQQVRQSATVCDVLLSAAGTNAPAVVSALLQLKPGLSEADARQWLSALQQPVLQGVKPAEADDAVKLLKGAGAKASVSIVPVGPDIARGWGKRRTVARDFLYDYPVALGSQRIGPDLANVSVRQPDAAWHLRHLYAPQLEVKGSAMPPYRFLFEKRNNEIVPKPEAVALVAYLLSLRADAPLFEAPLAAASAPAAPGATNAPPEADLAATNAPAASGAAPTNAAPTNAPAK